MFLRCSKLKRAIIFVCVAVVIWTACSAYTIASYAGQSEERAVDGIVVLGAGVFDDKPSPVFRERIKHALTLYQEGYASMIIFTGGVGNGDRLAESEVAQQFAQQRGVPAGHILIETRSKTTEQNLYYAKQVADENRVHRVIIVSDPLHMKRALLVADDIGFEAYSSPTPTTRYRSWQTRLLFLAREVYYYQRYLLRRPFFRYGE